MKGEAMEDAWHIKENVGDEFDWNEDDMVSYTYYFTIIYILFTGITYIPEEVELKEPRV